MTDDCGYERYLDQRPDTSRTTCTTCITGTLFGTLLGTLGPLGILVHLYTRDTNTGALEAYTRSNTHYHRRPTAVSTEEATTIITTTTRQKPQ